MFDVLFLVAATSYGLRALCSVCHVSVRAYIISYRCRNLVCFLYLIYWIWRRRFIHKTSFFFRITNFIQKHAHIVKSSRWRAKKPKIHFCFLLSHNKIFCMLKISTSAREPLHSSSLQRTSGQTKVCNFII